MLTESEALAAAAAPAGPPRPGCPGARLGVCHSGHAARPGTSSSANWCNTTKCTILSNMRNIVKYGEIQEILA